MPALQSADTSISTMAADLIRALTAAHRIKPTATSCHSAWRPKPGRRSTYRGGTSVQTTGTSSHDPQPMDRTVVYQRDSRVARLPGTAVELGEDDAAADAGRIFDLNVIAGRVVSKSNSESWPSLRYAGIEVH